MKKSYTRNELLELSKKKETEEEKSRNRIRHIIDTIYDKVISIAKNGYTTNYMYTIGYISESDLLNVVKELRKLFQNCSITIHQSPEHEAGGGAFSDKTSIRIDWQ
jgi:hypothetical protein